MARILFCPAITTAAAVPGRVVSAPSSAMQPISAARLCVLSLLVVTQTVTKTTCLTNQQFFNLVKDYATDIQVSEDTEDYVEPAGVISLPGDADDDVDFEYVFKRLGIHSGNQTLDFKVFDFADDDDDKEFTNDLPFNDYAYTDDEPLPNDEDDSSVPDDSDDSFFSDDVGEKPPAGNAEESSVNEEDYEDVDYDEINKLAEELAEYDAEYAYTDENFADDGTASMESYEDVMQKESSDDDSKTFQETYDAEITMPEDSYDSDDGFQVEQTEDIEKFDDGSNVTDIDSGGLGDAFALAALARYPVENIGKPSGDEIAACVKVQYLPANYGFEVTFTVNGHSLYNAELSLKHPPPLCYEVPGLGRFARVCLELYDINLHTKHVCARLTGVLDLKIKKFKVHLKLGCFRIPISDKDAFHLLLNDQDFQRSKRLDDMSSRDLDVARLLQGLDGSQLLRQLLRGKAKTDANI